MESRIGRATLIVAFILSVTSKQIDACWSARPASYDNEGESDVGKLNYLEPCGEDKQCLNNLRCLINKKVKVCQCDEDMYLDDQFQVCSYEYTSSHCREDLDCYRFSGDGNGLYCNPMSKMCECPPGTFRIRGECKSEPGIGKFCKIDDECSRNSKCSENICRLSINSKICERAYKYLKHSTETSIDYGYSYSHPTCGDCRVIEILLNCYSKMHVEFSAPIFSRHFELVDKMKNADIKMYSQTYN